MKLMGFRTAGRLSRSLQVRYSRMSEENVVLEKNEYYKEGKKYSFIVAIISAITLLISVAGSYFVLNKKDERVYFAVNDKNQFVKLVPFSEPNHKDSVVSQWLVSALIDTFDLNFVNYKTSLNDSAQKYFTTNGGKELKKALVDSGNLDAMVNKKLILSLSLESTPVMIKKGKPEWSDYYLWKLQVPGVLTYRNQGGEYSTKVMFTVVVSRQSMLSDPMGLGIAKIIMTNRNN